MPNLRLTTKALSSLKAIGHYTEQRYGVSKRQSYLKALDKTFHQLAKNPEQGKPRMEIALNLRSYPQGKHIIYYLCETDAIIIVDILHERMDYLRHLN